MNRAPLVYAFSAWPVRALALGLAGLWLNEIKAPLLGPESPHLLFGGWTGLVSFVWLGPAAAVQGIVEQSGGQLEVESAVGRGTVIRISLPCLADAGGEQATARPRRPWSRRCWWWRTTGRCAR